MTESDLKPCSQILDSPFLCSLSVLEQTMRWETETYRVRLWKIKWEGAKEMKCSVACVTDSKLETSTSDVSSLIQQWVAELDVNAPEKKSLAREFRYLPKPRPWPLWRWIRLGGKRWLSSVTSALHFVVMETSSREE